MSISCDAETTNDPNDAYVYAVSCMTNVKTHVHDTNAYASDATPLESREKLPQVIHPTSRTIGRTRRTECCATTWCSIRARTQPSISLVASHTQNGLTSFEKAFNLDNNRICMFLGKDNEYGIECRKVQCRHFLIELFRKR